MNKLLAIAAAAVVPLVAASSHAQTVINPVEDVMTSGFFFDPDNVRGFAGDNRPVLRVSTPAAFGVGREAIYLQFDPSDFGSFTQPVDNATLTVESVSGNFGADASAANPFTVSAHALALDPIDSIIDNTNPSGTISSATFYDTQVLPADPAALTVINGFGTFTFDVTELVNDWVDGSNGVFSLGLTGLNDTSGSDFLHGFRDNTETPGSTFLTVTPVPEPSVIGVLAGGLMLLGRRR